jgi:hypothetical protein
MYARSGRSRSIVKYGKQSVAELMNVSLSIFDTKHAIEINDQTY